MTHSGVKHGLLVRKVPVQGSDADTTLWIGRGAQEQPADIGGRMAFGTARISTRCSVSQNLNGGADLHLFVELNDIFVEHANAARGGFRANGPWFIRTVNAVQRVAAIAVEV